VTSSERLASDLRLDPPPPDAQPRITATDAYQRAQRNLPSDPGPDPTIALGLYSDDGNVRLNPDGSSTKLIQDRLAWVVVMSEAIVAPASGGPASPDMATAPPPPPCTFGTTIAPVDARTGAVLNVHQEGAAVR
jgi:hypothetical protein